MKQRWGIFLLSSLLVTGGATGLRGEPFLRLIQPFDNSTLPPVKSSFVFGSVLPATATLTLNGHPVQPHTNGGFLAMIPFEEGRFTIVAEAFDGVSTSTVKREVVVSEFNQTFPPDSSTLKPLTPTTRVVVRAGDIVTVAFQGAPEGKAFFKMGGARSVLSHA